MKIEELILKYVNKDIHERKLGRYWATDIYKILKKQITPENFFDIKPITDIDTAGRILDGMANERLLKDIYDYNKVSYKYDKDVVREMKIDDEITLIVKPDFEFPDWILETKNPIREREEIPEWYIFQLECEFRATKKPVWLGVFVHPFNIHFQQFIPDDERWKKIVTTLKNFHEELKRSLKNK